MTKEKKKVLKELEEKLLNVLNSIPDGILDKEPRFQLTGEIIPEPMRKDNKYLSYKFKIGYRKNKLTILPFIPKHIDIIGENGPQAVPFESDGNQIEISFSQTEDWNYYQRKSRGKFISTADIKAMADCIRAVISHEKSSAKYSCQDDFIRLKISYDTPSDTYNFTVSMLSMLEDTESDHYITITRKKLTKEKLDRYIDPFFKWEEMFPVIMQEKKVDNNEP